MTLTATNPGAIRDAIVAEIAGMTPSYRPEPRWDYKEDETVRSGSPRVYSAHASSSVQTDDGPWGGGDPDQGGGDPAVFELTIRVGLAGLPRSEQENIAHQDRKDLERLIRPLSQHNGQGIPGMLAMLDRVSVQVSDGFAVHTVPIHFWE